MELPNVYIVTNSVGLPACAVGDDEQSDWFFEGECGAGGMGIPSLLPSWDPDTPPVLEVPDPAPPTFLQPARPTQRGDQNTIHKNKYLTTFFI